MEALSDQFGSWVPWAVALTASFVAAATDLRTGKIYNWLTGPVFVAGLIWSAMTQAWLGVGDSILAAVLMASPFVALFAFGGGGAGDAKLMGALGAWLGPEHCISVLVAVLASGAAIGMAYAFAKHRASSVLLNVLQMGCGLLNVIMGRSCFRQTRELMPEHSRMLRIPYGVAICAGIFLAAMLQRAAGGS